MKLKKGEEENLGRLKKKISEEEIKKRMGKN